MSENVNHPKHYNSHPHGVECIDVIRHYVCDIANAIKYLWRAGLKPEMGKDDAEKEIEDLKKSLFYIDDYRRNCADETCAEVARGNMRFFLRKATGHSVREICDGYHRDIAKALELLLMVGLVQVGGIVRVKHWEQYLASATKCIQHRILKIRSAQMQKELDSTLQVIHGQAVDGEDYISKPACQRETEPERYDPLNMIVIFGTAYCLTDEPRKKDNGAYYSPCDICGLRDFCLVDHPLCRLHQANRQEYYREVGSAKYRPAFGTLEIIDPMKEAELELKQQEEDESNETL